MLKTYQLFINGKWVDAVSGKTFESINPSTGAIHAIVAEAGKQDIDLAVKAARNAFESGTWSNMDPSERGRLLYRAAMQMRDKLDFFAEIESMDNGLPINETKYIAIPATIDVLEFYAGLANKVQGETLASPKKSFELYIERATWGSWGYCAVEFSASACDVEISTSFSNRKYDCY